MNIRGICRLAVVSLLVVAVSLIAGGVVAGEAGAGQVEIEYRVDHNQPADQGPPVLTLQTSVPLQGARLELERDGAVHQTEQLGDLTGGQPVQVEIDQTRGHHRYDATVQGLKADGNEVTIGLSFEARVTGNLEVELLRDEVDLDRGLVPVRVNRPIERLEVQVADGQGERVVDEEHAVDRQQGRIDVRFGGADDISEARVTVHDVDGNWTTYTLEPFWIEIPQQVINFDTGDATVGADAAEKLAATRDKIAEALQGREHMYSQMRLYVAGYTDTVGDAEANRRLSQRRARSIAQWFDNHGIDIPIYYQGFGQDVLAVDTPDETAEEKNRRAVYILGNTPPPTSEQIPRSNWRRLQ